MYCFEKIKSIYVNPWKLKMIFLYLKKISLYWVYKKLQMRNMYWVSQKNSTLLSHRVNGMNQMYARILQEQQKSSAMCFSRQKIGKFDNTGTTK